MREHIAGMFSFYFVKAHFLLGLGLMGLIYKKG